jgi:hypothetical protein
MIKSIRQLGRRSVRLLAFTALLSTLAVGAMPGSASASYAGWWGQIISGNSLSGHPMCLANNGEGYEALESLQSPCNNSGSQLWHMQPTGDGYYTIQQLSNNECLDVYSFSHANGAKVTTWPCNGYTNQQWRVNWPAEGSGFSLKPRFAEWDYSYVGGGWYPVGKCLDVIGYSHDDGAQAWQWQCNGTANQKWSFDLQLAHS